MFVCQHAIRSLRTIPVLVNRLFVSQRLLGEQLAAFRIHPLALWTNDSFELLVSEEEAAPGAQEDEEGEVEEVETLDM